VVADLLPIWAVFVLIVAAVLAAFELGFLLGRRRHRAGGQQPEGSLGAMVGATMGLLAFVLAFTFSMTESRFETRKQLVVEEAAAVRKAYLRSTYLPEPDAKEVQARLQEYVAARVNMAEHPEHFQAALTRSEDLESLLWEKAAAAGRRDPNDITGLFGESINDVIDIDVKRIAAMRNRLPMAVWVSLYAMAILGLAGMGYHAGLDRSTRPVAVLIMTLAFSGVLGLIADLDRPREGFLRVSEQALIDVQKSMQETNSTVGR
jgi:hypothetical protein